MDFNPVQQIVPPISDSPNPVPEIQLLPSKPRTSHSFTQWLQGHRKKLLIGVGIAVLSVTTVLAARHLFLPLFQRGERITTASREVTLTPTNEDALGVDPASTFVLKSEMPLEVSTIQNAFRVSPALAYDVSKINDTSFSIAFPQALESGKIYRFQLVLPVEGEKAVDFSWAFQVKRPFRIIQTLPRDQATAVPLNSGIELTFTTDEYQDVDEYFEITPAVEGRFERHKRTVALVPKELKPATLYTVTVKKGLGLAGSDKRLEEDFRFQFETAEAENERASFRIGFDRNLSEFPSSEKPAYRLYVSDLNRPTIVAVDIYQLKGIDQFINALKQTDTIPVWARLARESSRFDPSDLPRVLNFNAPVQKFEYSGFIVFPQALSTGYYLLDASANERRFQTWLQVTDIATYLTTSNTKTLAWVQDIGRNEPASGATIRLVDSTVSQQTNGEGVAFFETPQEVVTAQHRRYYTVTGPSGASSVVPVDQHGGPYGYSYYGGYFGGYDGMASPRDQYWTYLYLDRPIYLPHDTVGYWGVIRDRDRTEKVDNLKLTLTRSEYHSYDFQSVTLLERNLDVSDTGAFIGEIPLTNVQPGYYSVSIVRGDDEIVNTGFSVETYTKPAYQMTLEPDKKAIFSGETVNFEGHTQFFEGTPVSRVKLSYSGPTSGEIESDDEGKFAITYTPPYEEGDTFYSSYPKMEGMNIAPTVSEEGDIEGFANVQVFGPRLALNATPKIDAGTGRVSFSAHHITLERLNNGTAKDSSDYLGEPVTGQAITGKLFEHRWDKQEAGEYYDFINKTTAKRYQYTDVKTFLVDVSVTTDQNGQAVYQFPVETEKFYQLDAETTDADGRRAVSTAYLYGSRSDQDQYRNQYYNLDTGRTSNDYHLGERVGLRMKRGQEDLPSGPGHQYLFRLAQRGLRSYRVGSSSEYTFSFEGTFVPNIVAKGIYWNGVTFFESDSTSLTFAKDDRKLAIEVVTDQASYRPKDTATLAVTVRDKNGVGQLSDVNISLVDEAIFKIQGQEVDTLGELYRFIPSGVIQSYASHQYPLEAGAEGGGGCFLAGTKILLPGDLEKNIEDVKTGDTILTRENERSHWMVEARVLKTTKHLVSSYLLINEVFRVTPEHNLYVNGRWMVAEDVRLGDHLLDRSDQWIPVTSIEERHAKVQVYNLEIQDRETFFADRFYVHNQKGRELFVDRTFFGAVRTDRAGNGSVQLKLPDNLTSWRITTQAISDALGAGHGTTLLPVKLPFFVDMVLNTQYLEGDKPVMTIRSFGDELSSGQAVTFGVEAPSLGIPERQTFEARAFERVAVPLPALPVGTHRVTVSGKSGNREDKVIRQITVVKSFRTRAETTSEQLSSTTKPTGSDQGTTTIVFTDQNRGRFYSTLARLSGAYGDRLDQKLARLVARALLSEYFGEEEDPETFTSGNYQEPSGGLTLFPYSDADLALSANAAIVARDRFDQNALAQYFYKVLDDRNEGRERATIALSGLAALEEPVLVPIKRMLRVTDLSLTERLALTRGLALLGDIESSRAELQDILEDHGEKLDPFVRIKSGADQDDLLELTAQAAVVAAVTGEEHADGLFQYITRNATKDILLYLEQLAYMKSVLPRTTPQGVQFTYVLGGKRVTKQLEKGEIFRLELLPQERSDIRFEDIQGNVGVTTRYAVPVDQGIRTDSTISVRREYQPHGRAITREFSESDLVQVNLPYSLSDKALDGCYQVTDYLPAGLKIVSKPYSRGISDQNVWYPYEINGQRISFCVSKGSSGKPIRYYARVVSKGDFTAEGPIMQSLRSVGSFNLSDSTSVTIK